MIDDWELKFKYYPHFDAPISRADITKLVADPVSVRRNKFYPFMRYEQSWQPFRTSQHGKAAKPNRKIRPIRYASRRDAYIFSYYRHLLSAPYEKLLAANHLDHSVIAYRRIRQIAGSGKSNIEFARDAFNTIRRLGNCAAVALDISSFFESLDHDILRNQWLKVIGKSKLPVDHAAVLKAVTRYAVVDLDDVYERLGYIKRQSVSGRERLVFTIARKSVPIKFCSNKDFREKVCGLKGKYKSLVDVNRQPYGIPQGTPISDLLANIYLIDFDIEMKSYCDARGGTYYRYSDDILVILPGSESEGSDARNFAMNEIRKCGKNY